MTESDFPSFGNFFVSESIMDEFREDGWRKWAAAYPMLFDSDDQDDVESQHRTHHFSEWMAAIIALREGDWLSLQSKYDHKSHKQKQRVVEQLRSGLAQKVRDLRDTWQHRLLSRIGPPDLLAYKRDMTDWCFVEVKGFRKKGKDRWGEHQPECFCELRKETGKPVYLLEIKKLPQGECRPANDDAPFRVFRTFTETLPP